MPTGLEGAMAPMTRGYLQQEGVEMQRSAGQAEAAARTTERAEESELRKVKMDQVKTTMRKENFKEALQHMMTGDFGAAEEAYGRSGKRKMEKGSARAERDEEGNTFFTWVDDESGDPVVTEMKYAMMMTGITPKSTEMPAEAHARAMELAGVKAKGKAGTTNLIKNVEYFMGTMTGRDGKPITKQELFTKLTGSKKSREGMAIQLRGQILKRAADEVRTLSGEDLKTEVSDAMKFIGTFGDQTGAAMNGPGGPKSPVSDEVAGYIESARKKKEAAARLQTQEQGQAEADFENPEMHDF